MTRSVITFDNVASKPTTRAGYGITDASGVIQQYAVSYLVIGGGGGGGTSAYNDGAGGGAGGYRSNWRENQRDGQIDRQQYSYHPSARPQSHVMGGLPVDGLLQYLLQYRR